MQKTVFLLSLQKNLVLFTHYEVLLQVIINSKCLVFKEHLFDRKISVNTFGATN